MDAKMAQLNMAQVFDPEESQVKDALDFLSLNKEVLFKLRRQLRPKVKERVLLCPRCYQPLILAGSTDQSLHFRHVKDSDDCPIKTTCNLTEEEINAIKFNGQKEGRLHKENKEFIHDILTKDHSFSGAVMEKTFREENPTGTAKEWRRPDVHATFELNQADIAFELQVSTTFIDTIIDRENFYRRNNKFILWIFVDHEKHNFTELDILYANRCNAFILDDEAKQESIAQQQLVLKCSYKEITASRQNLTIKEEWQEKLVTISELNFDSTVGKLYFRDPDKLRILANKQIGQWKREAEIEKQKRIDERVAYLKEQESKTFASRAINPSASSKRAYGKYSNKPQIKGPSTNKIAAKPKNQVMLCKRCYHHGMTKNVGSYLICAKCSQPTNES